jgi:pilus assembly protein CpaF
VPVAADVHPRAFSIDDLEAAETLRDGAALLLREIVRARAAFLVSGGTGSGKTTPGLGGH